MKMIDKAKKCPFCGGEAMLERSSTTTYGRHFWMVGCDSCEVYFKDRVVWSDNEEGTLDKAYPEKECLARWNERAGASEAERAIVPKGHRYCPECNKTEIPEVYNGEVSPPVLLCGWCSQFLPRFMDEDRVFCEDEVSQTKEMP